MNQKVTGRTVYDLIHDHRKFVLITSIALLIVVIVIVFWAISTNRKVATPIVTVDPKQSAMSSAEDTLKKPSVSRDNNQAGRDVITGSNVNVDNSVHNYYGTVIKGTLIPPAKLNMSTLSLNRELDNFEGKYNLLPRGKWYQSVIKISYNYQLKTDTLWVIFRKLEHIFKASFSYQGPVYMGAFETFSRIDDKNSKLWILNPPNGDYEIYIISASPVPKLQDKILVYRK
jgi:hypothetical protein